MSKGISEHTRGELQSLCKKAKARLFSLLPCSQKQQSCLGPINPCEKGVVWQNCKKLKRGVLYWERSSHVNYNQSCNMDNEIWGVSFQIIASRHLCFFPLPTLRGSGGGMLHVGSRCHLIVSCFNILPQISFSRGWHEGLITLIQDRRFSMFTFCLLWPHFLRNRCTGHSRYHGINPRVLFSTVWFLFCSSRHVWEMLWPTGSRAGSSKFWKALHLWPWHHY